MTVDELIKALGHFDGDTEVRISQPTHNYWREVAAAEIQYVDESNVGDDGMIYDSGFDAINNDTVPAWMIVIRG